MTDRVAMWLEQSARPCHCVAEPGDPRTICGIKSKDGDGLPRVWIRYAQAHIDGHGLIMCPDCWPTAAPVEQGVLAL